MVDLTNIDGKIVERPEPEAVIERLGRYLYRVSVVDGIFEWGTWTRFGANRAVRKGSYELLRYLGQKEIPTVHATIKHDGTVD